MKELGIFGIFIDKSFYKIDNQTEMLRSKQSQVNNAMVNRPEIFVNIMSLVDNFHNCHQLVLVSPSTYLFLHKTDYIQK